ncbi:hypothetical protein B7990_12790 [Fibrobacter sp. UWB4]|jgi:hypothetical protein|uniref:hypothetical protein n=1 Tax=Fibrobacter sp. UWB4 TaxID=1964356 RepID=UPI000B520A70|nr:hypothetical protein [Fibrobacter sp. UWB4]MBO4829491.1 hypothetical protein [Fibrobacter sp.]OWV16103.1 hypothetical protein B7990_12790 [Fibrobacter sp. UWB4]
MHDKIDFSRLERIEPRKGSWETVCARLDSSEKRKVLNFIQTRTKYVLAASFIVAAFFTTFMTITSNTINSEGVLMTNVASSELASWYGNLGEKSDDELENLDTYTSISYLLQETK